MLIVGLFNIVLGIVFATILVLIILGAMKLEITFERITPTSVLSLDLGNIEKIAATIYEKNYNHRWSDLHEEETKQYYRNIARVQILVFRKAAGLE